MNFTILLLLFLATTCFAQKARIDSLEKALATSIKDTNRVNDLDRLTYYYAKSDPTRADSLGKVELKLSQELNFKKGIAGAYHNLGSLHYKTGNMDSAFVELEQALSIYHEINNERGESAVMLSMGSLLEIKGEYNKALEYFLKANKIGEKLNDKQVIAKSLHNTGMIYMEQGSYKQALENFEKALKIKEEIGDKRSMYSTLTNMGITYFKMGDLPKCEYYIRLAMDVAKQTEDKRSIATCYENLGNVYTARSQYDSAVLFFKHSKEMREALNDQKGVASALANMGEALRSMGKYDEALDIQLQAVTMLEKLGDKNQLKNVYQMVSQTYEAKKDYRSALLFSNKHIQLKDSLFSDENNKQIAEMQAKYDSEKKQREIELLKKDDENQRLFKNSLMIGIGLLFVLAVVMLYSYVQKRKANNDLSEKNEIIEESRGKLQVAFAEIEEKNKDITDSIIYAKRIQDAILPSISSIQKNIPDSFVLFKPRDIVSGDFYWSAAFGNKIILAVADCTGHGVPGAFMSMIGNTLLNEIVNVKGILKPSEILELLDLGIKNALQHDDQEKSSDGMDIGICAIENGMKLEFSGALRPLLLLRKNAMTETKGDKRSIGAHDIAAPFTNHIMDLQKGDSIYLFSDGYADQFGGDKGKKMMRKNFNELILKHSQLPMKEQAKVLEKQLIDWKGNYEQVDDVCVIGLRV